MYKSDSQASYETSVVCVIWYDLIRLHIGGERSTKGRYQTLTRAIRLPYVCSSLKYQIGKEGKLVLNL